VLRLAAAMMIIAAAGPQVTAAQPASPLMPIDLLNSAEAGWRAKPVLASRPIPIMKDDWVFQGTGQITNIPARGDMLTPGVRVVMDMFTKEPAPTRNRLSSVNLRRNFANEDWRGYNRLSVYMKAKVVGFPMLPLQIVFHNDGVVKIPDRYNREGTHYVTLDNEKWTQVTWEIEPLARDRVTHIEIGYWVNKMLASPGDRVEFEIAGLELQKVEPDHYAGWNVAPGKISFSHTGYWTRATKTAIASDLSAREFKIINVDVPSRGTVLTRPVRRVRSHIGTFHELDFSSIDKPGTYVIEAGGIRTKPFRIDDRVWTGTIWKTLNFFYGERCGIEIPGVHGDDHNDWFATLGDRKIVMNGGWHDAGDLSQGAINTGEATYAMFSLAESLAKQGADSLLVKRLIDEGRWGLYWLLKVRFPGGYRMGFASHNLWTNNIVGDADDRSREAKNNPNVNYIAAAAGAIAYRVLRDTDSELAARALDVAEDDWRHAIVGKENAETRHTVAFAASPMELAGIGILASLELYRATEKQLYADKAVELANVILASQQKTFVGTRFPLSGFFYTGPDRDTLFHQFHRGNDQAPIVALVKLAEALPYHRDWIKWYSAVTMYSEYKKAGARTTEPYGVLPSYVYREDEHLQRPATGALHGETHEAFMAQVLEGMPMGEGYYLRKFPVWFARQGNFGSLLSQAKAVAAAARLRQNKSLQDLAQLQAQWIVGRNPFVQSTMYGEGYDYAQQYSVSSGDFVGSLPVGMQSRGARDIPYWPQQNMYVYKEVWVHPSARWLWLMEELMDPTVADVRAARQLDYSLRSTTRASGAVTITATAHGSGTHSFVLRSDNLIVTAPTKRVTLRSGRATTITWTARLRTSNAPWVAVVVADNDVAGRREATGHLPRYRTPSPAL
jgi:hypothetical protein